MQVAIKQKVAEFHFGRSSKHFYFLVDRVSGEFVTGTGEEFTDADPDHPQEGIYIPIWMPVDELAQHQNIYPSDLTKLVIQSVREGWAKEPVVLFTEP